MIFKDEEKFNLYRPEGFAQYWHDLQKEPQYFSNRLKSGGSLTVWTAIVCNGISSIALLNGSTAYEIP